MNNIEILEEFRKSIKNFNNYADNTNVSLINKKQVKAIENLIQENKELKEELKYTKKQIPQDKIFYYSEKDYIPKSKVKEKIEEYSKMINATYNDISSSGDYRRNVCFEIRKVLKELLEEGE